MKILVVVAHPDDEILGIGGTLIKHRDSGDEIYIHILTDGHSSRLKSKSTKMLNDKQIKRRISSAKKAAIKLNASKIIVDKFGDQMLDQYPILNITKAIEKFAKKINPNIVYTHFEGDVNPDHQVISKAVLNAFRPVDSQLSPKILCSEIPSSTEWGISSFHPNYFVDISFQLDEKLDLLKYYDYELKKYPHPRSIEAIKNLAFYRGTNVSVKAAEAFYLIRDIWK